MAHRIIWYESQVSECQIVVVRWKCSAVLYRDAVLGPLPGGVLFLDK